MVNTRALLQAEMIVTGNTKAAVKAAGGGSSDLWTVPPGQIHYDARDNVRPLDPDRVRHVANLIKINGYDRKKPLGCFVRKVGGTIRDVLLLANAPAALHKLVREKVVSSTLAIEEIRTHGGQKAVERLVTAATQVKASGKVKVTKKALGKPASHKITDVQAKQLLQALQAVLHDASFGKLSRGTIAGVHTALTPLVDMLDAKPRSRSPAVAWPFPTGKRAEDHQ